MIFVYMLVQAFDAKDVSPMLKHLLETGAVNVKGVHFVSRSRFKD